MSHPTEPATASLLSFSPNPGIPRPAGHFVPRAAIPTGADPVLNCLQVNDLARVVYDYLQDLDLPTPLNQYSTHPNWEELRRANNPIVGSYIDDLEPSLATSVKFQMLYQMMTEDLRALDAAALDGLENAPDRVFDSQLYVELAHKFQDGSLKAAWTQMRQQLEAEGARDLPAVEAQADAIRDWFDKNEGNPALENVKALDFRGLSLLVIPTQITRFTGLEELDLSGNRIKVVSSQAFNGLSRLKRLYLSANRIATLPESVFRGSIRLKRLDLDGNRIAVLPENLFLGLVELGGIHLDCNEIVALPENVFLDLVQLKWLCLNHNQIEVLPENLLRNSVQLERLYLEHNRIAVLPENIFLSLQQLERLYLHDNLFTHFDTSFHILNAQAKIAAISNFHNRSLARKSPPQLRPSGKTLPRTQPNRRPAGKGLPRPQPARKSLPP